MTPPQIPITPVDDLIAQLDAAVTEREPRARCAAVQRALQSAVCRGPLLDDHWLAPVASGYGRRLLHLHPQRLYSVVVMSWGPGQGTPIHDHAGLWCVECVCRGQVSVSSFAVEEQRGERVRFVLESRIDAGVGEAGSLIPPFDYHVIENATDEPAATLHVYGGEMVHCSVFEPDADGFSRRLRRQLSYTGD